MEKVTLTQAQADAIKELRSRDSDYWTDENLIKVHANDPNNWHSMLALNGLPLITLVDALRIEYEVQPEYKVGDVVKYELGDGLYEIYRIPNDGWAHLEGEKGSLVKHVPYAYIKHATPEEIKAEKERRVWAKIGREPGEFRDGDVGLEALNGAWSQTINGDACYLKEKYEDGRLKGFYPAEAFVSLGGDE